MMGWAARSLQVREFANSERYSTQRSAKTSPAACATRTSFAVKYTEMTIWELSDKPLGSSALAGCVFATFARLDRMRRGNRPCTTHNARTPAIARVPSSRAKPPAGAVLSAFFYTYRPFCASTALSVERKFFFCSANTRQGELIALHRHVTKGVQSSWYQRRWGACPARQRAAPRRGATNARKLDQRKGLPGGRVPLHLGRGGEGEQ